MASERLLLLVLLLLPACYASNVVALKDREVVVAAADLAWQAGTAADVPGYFASVEITGEVALALRQVYYLFRVDGSYSGAALVDDGGQSSFETRNGSWQFVDGGLSLDGSPPAPVQVAAEHLQLTSPNGKVVLHRLPLP